MVEGKGLHEGLPGRVTPLVDLTWLCPNFLLPLLTATLGRPEAARRGCISVIKFKLPRDQPLLREEMTKQTALTPLRNKMSNRNLFLQGLLLWWQRTGMDTEPVVALSGTELLTALVVPATVLPPQGV